jgi:hypothetical protein
LSGIVCPFLALIDHIQHARQSRVVLALNNGIKSIPKGYPSKIEKEKYILSFIAIYYLFCNI